VKSTIHLNTLFTGNGHHHPQEMWQNSNVQEGQLTNHRFIVYGQDCKNYE